MSIFTYVLSVKKISKNTLDACDNVHLITP